MALLAVFLACLATFACVSFVCLLAYGGVWGVARIVREQLRDLAFRIDTAEKQLARGNGRVARETVLARKSEDDQIADQLAERALREQRSRPTGVPRLRLDEDGFVQAPPEVTRRARAEADKAAAKGA